MSERHAPAGSRLRSPAIDFIQTRLPEYHAAFDQSNIRFDIESDKFVSTLQSDLMALVRSNDLPFDVGGFNPPPRPLAPPIDEMECWQGIFSKAMTRLQSTPESVHRSELGYSIRSETTWEGVWNKLIQARNAYDGKPADENEQHGDDSNAKELEKKSGGLQKFFGKMKRGTRTAGEIAATPLQQVIKLVPNHPIVSPVLTAVNLLLDAWKQAGNVRKETYNKFDNVEIILKEIDLYGSLFPNDPNITKASEDLVYVTFVATESAIGFYTSLQVVRLFAATFQGEEYQQKLRDNLDQIKSRSEELKKHAMMSFQYHMINDSAEARKQREQITRELHLKNQITVTALESVYRLLKELDNKVDKMGRDIQNPRKPITESGNPHEENSQLSVEHPTCTPESLWKWLDIPDLEETDMQAIMNRARGLDPDDRGKAEQIVDTRQFRNWLLGNGLPKLLIHGDFDQAQNLHISPLSVICTTFVQALRSRPDFISLVFFCGCHVLPSQEYTGGVAILRSLLVQLLRQRPSTPVPLEAETFLDEMTNGDIQHLCKLLFVLVKAIPATTTVIFVIDGVNFYEHRFMDGLEEVLITILNITEDEGEIACHVKLLLTSPRNTRHVRKAFNEAGSILSMATIPYIGNRNSEARFGRRMAEDLEDASNGNN